MGRVLDTKEYLDMVCELLEAGKTDVPVPVAGSSMTPFLHPGDTVYLNPATPPLRKGDIVLYTRPGGRYVLHRIVKVNADGSFIMLGDAQQEREWIESKDQIHARVTSALHGEKLLTPKSFRWRFFATVWRWAVPLRRWIMTAYARIRKKITR